MIKCGGTSINHYFTTKFHANSALDASSIRNLSFSQRSLIENITDEQVSDILKRLVEFRFDHYSFVHGHNPLTWGAPKDFFKFIILRNPIDRVISQIMDWKRLTEQDLNGLPDYNKNFKIFAKQNSIGDIMDIWDTCNVGINNLSNMQTNLIYKAKNGILNQVIGVDKSELLRSAKTALYDYDYIGLTEHMDETISEICYLNKWCPPITVTRLNSTIYSSKLDQQTIEKITNLNLLDIELYQLAKELFSKNDYSFYSLDYFEDKFAAERTKAISPIYHSGEYLFNFNMPIIGNGFHLRDAANTSECAVWTGPGTTSSLFMPVVPQCDINVLLYIKGFSHPSLKESIIIEINGKKTPYEFRSGANVDSVLTAQYITTKTFIHIKVMISETYNSDGDKRPRGVSLLKYGFSCNL